MTIDDKRIYCLFMKPKIKKKWLKALRSGEYAQCKKVLVNNIDEFCCLGVLCDISDKGEWIDPKSKDNHYIGKWHYELDKYDEDWAELPAGISTWSEINPDEEVTLTRMNDAGYSFKEIADYIEKNL